MKNVTHIDFATRERRQFIQQQPTPETLRERFARFMRPTQATVRGKWHRVTPDPDGPAAA